MVYLPILYSALFFLQLSYGSTHSLAKLQANKNADVYEVLEDKQSNSISFINPKAQKPTLREIVYYHIVERPYLNDVNPEGSVEDTERPFTNGHSLPNNNADEVGDARSAPLKDTEIATSSKDNNLKLVENKSEDKSNSDESAKNEQESSTELYDEEDEELKVSEAANTKQNDKQIKEIDDPVSSFDAPAATAKSHPINSENPESPKRVEESASEGGTDHLKTEDTFKYGNDTNIGNEEVTKDDVPDFTKERFEPTTEKTFLTRNKLFDNIKMKYGKFVNANRTESTLQRRKRHAEDIYIPEAPILPGMNFQPVARRSVNTDPEDEAKREIKNKIEKMFDDVTQNMKNKQADEPTANAEHSKPRTYGMNLSEDHGFVWNNIFTKPGVAFSVGNQDTNDKTHSYATPTDTSVSENNDNVAKEPISEEDKETSPNNEDLEDIEVNVNKKKEKTEVESNEKKEDERGDGFDDKKDDEKNKHKTVDDEVKAITPFGKSLYHDEEEIETDLNKEHETDKRKGLENEHKKEHHDTDNDHDETKSIKEKKIDGLNSLMANKQFWEWLGDWTSIYMEVFVQNVGSVIKEEIKKQMAAFSTANANVSDPHADKTEQELRHKHHNKDNKGTKVDKTKDAKANTTISKIPVSVTSEKIYGNSVGNEKVNNIFIFYPNEKSDKIIEDLKPVLNPPSKKPEDKKDTIVINKDKVTDQESDKPMKLKPELTKPLDKDSKDKESEKLDTTKKEDKAEETTEKSDKAETTDKSTEQVESTTKGDTVEAKDATTVENKSKESDVTLDKNDVTTESVKDTEKSKETTETAEPKE